MATCAEAACQKTAHARGLCGTHYARAHKSPSRLTSPKECVHCGGSYLPTRAHHKGVCSTECLFWSRVKKGTVDECWPWQGATLANGYGRASEKELAHRLSWTIHNGPIAEGLCVCHSCDERVPPGDISYRRCCNPRHLFLGTNTENHADCAAKGRSAFGERNGFAKLTEAQVTMIRESVKSSGQLARELGLGRTTVSDIRLGKRWKRLEKGGAHD